MKVWKAAEIVELDVRETANGEYDNVFEVGDTFNNSANPDTNSSTPSAEDPS